MSDRTNYDIYKRHPDDRQALSKAKKEKKKANGIQAGNHQRLTDIQKLIAYDHPKGCNDRVWLGRYFRAALPHVLSAPWRVKAAGGCYVTAMSEWVGDFIPFLLVTRGTAWIEKQVNAWLAKPAHRRCPRIDRTNNLLRIEDHKPKAAGLCCLSAMSRPKKVRDAEDAARRAQAERDRRAQNPNYKPHSESKAAKLRAEGKNLNTEKSRDRRAKKAAEKAAAEALRHQDGPNSDAWWDAQIAKAALYARCDPQAHKPVTIFEVKALDAVGLAVACRCGHRGQLTFGRITDDTLVPNIASRVCCTSCGERGASMSVHPYWTVTGSAEMQCVGDTLG